MKDIMLADTPIEQRGAILRDSCDQIVERSYTRKFGSDVLMVFKYVFEYPFGEFIN